MTIETASYVSQLNASNPATGDKKVEGDNHLRLIKGTIKNTFPIVSGVVSANASELMLFTQGGTISGALTVKGNISASSITSDTMLIDVTSTASPTEAGVIKFDTTEKVLKVGNGTETKSYPTDQAYMIATGPILYSDPSGILNGEGLSASSGRFIYLGWDSYQGENWLNTKGFAVVPKGEYEVTYNLGFNASSSSATYPQISVYVYDALGSTDIYQRKGELKTGSRSSGLSAVVSTEISATMINQFILQGLDGRINIDSSTLVTKLIVRRI